MQVNSLYQEQKRWNALAKILSHNPMAIDKRLFSFL